MGTCHFRGRNGPFVLNKSVLVQTIIITFIYLLALFIVQNFQKNSYSRSRVMRTRHFCVQNGPFDLNNFFLEKIMNIIFIYLLTPFIVKKILKILTADPVLWRCATFWAIENPFAKMRFFFRKPVNNSCFFHSCLSTCQVSKSDVDLLKKYWQLKNTEISLAKRDFW